MKNNLKILMLEDMEEDAALIDWTLKKDKISFTSVRVDSREDFIEALDSFQPDVVLSDHSLPQFNSIEALEICKNKKIGIPFILVTGAVSEEFAVKCLKRGADDYILKSNLSRLPIAIQYALRQHQYEHERVVQEETLLHQNEELEKINKELDSFVYSISHNLRSPLSSVLGVVNIAKLDRRKNVETVDHYFEMIEGSILRLDKTLQEILDYSQNIRTELEVSEINFSDLLEQCFDQVKYLKGADKIIKTIQINQETPFYSDAHRLFIVFTNLVSNAVRYRDETKTDQRLEIQANINPAFATITMKDNGIGIADKYLPQVFNMFFRGTDRSEGAGLGLYIAREMVEKLDGNIKLNSFQYLETCVSINIPNKLLMA